MPVVNTSNIGRRADGTFEQYVPPRVIEETGGGGPTIVLPQTAIQRLTGQAIPAGNWAAMETTGATSFIASDGTTLAWDALVLFQLN